MSGINGRVAMKKKWSTPQLTVLVRGDPGEDILGCCKMYHTVGGGPFREWGRCGSGGARKCGERNSAYEPGGTDYFCGDREPSCSDACCGDEQKCGVGGCLGCGNSCKKTVSS